MPRIKSIRIPIDPEVYEIAKDEAKRCGFSCTGTKIRYDLEQLYRRLARRRITKREVAR